MKHLPSSAIAFLLLAPATPAQTSFSIDFHGPTKGMLDCGAGVPMTEGDILAPCLGAPAPGPVPEPMVSISAGIGGLGSPFHGACLGAPPVPGVPCMIEIDALSFGTDGFVGPVDQPPGRFVFSVDEFAAGFPSGAPPEVASEAPFGDAAADVFIDMGLPLGSFPLPPGFFPNRAEIDGDGLASGSGFAYFGLGLIEPTLPGPPPDPGDNLDALDLEGPPSGTFPATGVYFSLDSAFPDPVTGVPGSGSAGAHFVVGGDVIFLPAPGAPPAVYAPAMFLGLDLVGGPGSDDLDALALRENGVPAYQPSHGPFDWTAGATDMLLFSVRRGSAVIGLPDSLLGIPIEPGDVLMPPVAGGLTPFPAIFIQAEALGLLTMRSGLPLPSGHGDDLDALDVRDVPPALFTSMTCFGVGCPCSNDDPTAGCANSTGSGGLLAPSAGTSSVTADDLVLTAVGLPTFNQGLFYMGDTLVSASFYDGIQCALGTTFRFLGSIQSSGATGTMTYTGWVGASGGVITSGSTWYFHCWHRDVPGTPCGTGANLTNVVGVLFTP